MKAYNEMDHAQIECPECAQQITVNSSAAVDNVDCPYCKFTVVIPPSSQEPMLQEPMLQEPMLQEPMLQEPMLQEPMLQEPMPQEPMLQEPMLQEPSLNDEPDPDLPEPLLDNFSVEPSKSEIKTDSFTTVDQLEAVPPPLIKNEIPVAQSVETQASDSSDIPLESKFEKVLICIAFLVAIAAVWAFFL